jgi:hypothetical protein
VNGVVRPDAMVRRRGVVAVARVVLVGCLLAAMLGSRPLLTWAEARPDLPVWVDKGLHQWDAAMTRAGLAGLHPMLRGLVERIREP